MTEEMQQARRRAERVSREVEVLLLDPDVGTPLGTATRTLDVSERGLLVEVPVGLDLGFRPSVLVRLRWEGCVSELSAEVVRLSHHFWRDRQRTVVGLQLGGTLPASLLAGPADVS